MSNFDLIVKLPKGKPPFIGILFSTETEANTLNQELVNDFKYRPYRIILEPLRDFINLRLVCEEIVVVKFYNH
jgi:hypothetical protein